MTGNVVTGHSGRSPLSGGIVLFKSFVGVTSERNRITGNHLRDNSPADLVDQEAAKSGNAFGGNSCRASKPRACADRTAVTRPTQGRKAAHDRTIHRGSPLRSRRTHPPPLRHRRID